MCPLPLFCKPGRVTKGHSTHLRVAKEPGQRPAWRRPRASRPLLPPQWGQCLPQATRTSREPEPSRATCCLENALPADLWFWLLLFSKNFSLSPYPRPPRWVINYLHAQDRNTETCRKVRQGQLCNPPKAVALKILAIPTLSLHGLGHGVWVLTCLQSDDMSTWFCLPLRMGTAMG